MPSLDWVYWQSTGVALPRSILSLQEGGPECGWERGPGVREESGLPLCLFLDFGPDTSPNCWGSCCPSWRENAMIVSMTTSVGRLPAC